MVYELMIKQQVLKDPTAPLDYELLTKLIAAHNTAMYHTQLSASSGTL